MRSVTLSQDHKEGTVQYVKGQTVLLPKASADFLINAHLAKRAEEMVVTESPAQEPSEPIAKKTKS